jgi:hypothetical protein
MGAIAKSIRQPTAKIYMEIRAAEANARKLLGVIVYGKSCRIGDRLALDDLIAVSDIGDWKMSAFEAARTYAAAQGWLVIEGDRMRLTTAGSAAA